MIAAVIPVKRLSDAKSRLSPRLSADERAGLVTALLRRTIRVLRAVDEVERIGVATEERELVASLSEVEWLPDMGGLNSSLDYAAGWAMDLKARSVLIVPCDLPTLEPGDIRALLGAGSGEQSVVVAATQDGGTAALLLTPPRVIAPLFGPDSFARHLRAAQRAGIATYTVARAGFSRELDTVDDLDYLDAHQTEFGSLTR